METKVKRLVSTANTETEFVGKLFHCGDVLHLAHLKTTSDPAHRALGDLYEAVREHADTIAELIQGYKGIQTYSIPASNAEEPIGYLKEIRTYITSKQAAFNYAPDIQNKLQDLIGDITRGLYKLENLK